MSIRNLNYLFDPKSIAVIGASNKQHSVGATVLANLRQSKFSGPVMPVNPKYKMLENLEVYPNVGSLPVTPDIAIICTPPKTVPGLIAELGERGTKAAIVLTAGLNNDVDHHGITLKELMLRAARPHLLCIFGPNCVGLILPRIGLNASFAHTNALPGQLAFVSQSGALTTAVLDWANSKGIGFSHFISLGESADVDFGDVLDYLGSDPHTNAILLYAESIHAARKFMSAARAAARNKRVLIVKAGRAPEGAKAATSHTGALAGADDVYDAAIRRAGMLRVFTTEDLFNAAEILARPIIKKGDRLTIMTNGGGAGVLAADAVAIGQGLLTSLTENTLSQLDKVLPSTWSRANPIDIIGDAPVQRYVDTLRILQQDPQSDSILFIHAPTAIVPSTEIAQALVEVLQLSEHNVFSCWLGGDAVAEARKIFRQAGIPTYETPEQAVWAFQQLVNYRHNQELLIETPPSTAVEFTPDVEKTKAVIHVVLKSGRSILTEVEAKAILVAYGIPTVETRVASTPDEASRIAEELGFPVAIKILSPDITHKSDVGGVALDQETPDSVRATAKAMQQRIQIICPEAQLNGFTVQRMVRKINAFELILGISTDPVFGPVILFGQGGTAVEVIRDRAVGLPPLNLNLAKELVSRTRISKLLGGYRNRPAIDHAALYLTLTKISQLICDIPEITELDINPLLVDETGVLALDARIKVMPASDSDDERLAIRPYPKEQEEWLDWNNRKILLRPIRPEDEPQHNDFFKALTSSDIHSRFFGMIHQPDHSQLSRLTQIDYDREMAFIAVEVNKNNDKQILGVVRAIADPDNITAEFAIIVRSDIKHHGLGTILLKKLIRYCKNRKTRELFGETLENNLDMLNLARELGFVSSIANGCARLQLIL